MKLTVKLALAVLPGALVVVAAAAVLELGRDRREFEADQRADDRAMARALADGYARVWQSAGAAAGLGAVALLRTAGDDDGDSHYRIRWIDLGDDGTDASRAEIPREQRRAVSRGEVVQWRDGVDSGRAWLHTAAAVRAASGVVGAIDVSEPPLDLRAHVRRTIWATIITTLVLTATMMFLTLLVGGWMVGRPISSLIAQARRVATGDLGARSLLRQDDELGQLARELNRMLDQLEAAAAAVRVEARKRYDALEQLRHAERLKTIGQLASSVAHELGTPLNVVVGRARLIVEGDASTTAHAAIIIDQGNRMARIIRQLLDYARRRPPHKQPEDLARLTADVVPLVSTLASKRGIQLRFQSEVDTAPVTADATQVQQAVTNLVINAVQASTQGSVVDLRVRAAARGRPQHGQEEGGGGPELDVFEVSVQDHGGGMSGEVLARVFEPFFTTKPAGESTGLGLSIAHEIADEHGGWIQAESTPGQGSWFCLVLPRRSSS